ncbi:MAG: ATP-binding protein [Coriobacteriia bacterium]|nr:ATP-binding protein [Coriobacteriia bacterium]
MVGAGERRIPDPQELRSLLISSEDWLMSRILSYAREHGFTPPTSTPGEAWRVSIQGLTESLVAMLDERGCDLDLTCDEDVMSDSALEFGIAKARLHRSRGVSLQMFLPLMKYYRTSYEDLVRERIEDRPLAWKYRDVIARFFDRVEIGYVVEWAEVAEHEALAEMQERARATTDVAERHDVEQELRASQRQYESLFHNMMNAFAHHRVVRDGDGCIVDYEFLEFNEAFEEMTGLSAQTSIGRWATELLPSMVSESFDWIGTYACVVDQQAETSFESHSESLGRWYDVQAYPTGPNTFAAVFRDVTASKTQEDRLEALIAESTRELQESLDALAEANRVKDDFLASMSHELRTPLNSVIGFSGMLLSGLAGELNEEQTRQIGMIRSSGERLLVLVNDVLDLSRIEAGYVDVTVHEFDLLSLCEQVTESLRPVAVTKGLELIVRYDDLVIPVWTDEDKTAQILLNLISNALKFTDKGRVLVESSMSRDGMTAFVRVTDTGRGINPDDMRHVFERFHRTDITKSLKNGAGLGLAISRRLAELLGGRIEVASAPDIGSAFTLVIPVRHESAML